MLTTITMLKKIEEMMDENMQPSQVYYLSEVTVESVRKIQTYWLGLTADKTEETVRSGI